MKNDFYVYEWFNKDTDEVFYVGKGTGNRYKIKSNRNNYFKNYINKYKCDVRKIKDNITEKEAFALEIETIAKYKKINQCQCNLTIGGEGCTFEEGSWNQLYKSIQFTHNVKNRMRDFYNEEDFDSDNLKNKTIEELEQIYDEYQNYKESNNTCRELGIKIEEELNSYELAMKNSEIIELTKIICSNIAYENEKFKSYLNMKNEIDFLCSEFEWDDFIDCIYKGDNFDYFRELILTIRYNMRFIRMLGDRVELDNKLNGKLNSKLNLHYHLQSFNLKDDDYWHIKFNTYESKKMNRCKVYMRDLIMALIMMDDNGDFFNSINKEILVAPIYK